jgi:hypothetical protein
MKPPHLAAAPPLWAEAALKLVLARKDRDSVSGDLLEAYRDSIVPARGQISADAWYVRQVAGFVWRATWLWAVVFSGAFVARNAVDWLIPTTDFFLRSEVSTFIAIGTLLLTGFWAAWRSGSAMAGLLVTILTTLIAAIFSVVGSTVLLAILHSPSVDRNIAGSGGIEEVYVLPFIMIVPAAIAGTVGAVVGRSVRIAQVRSSQVRSTLD